MAKWFDLGRVNGNVLEHLLDKATPVPCKGLDEKGSLRMQKQGYLC